LRADARLHRDTRQKESNPEISQSGRHGACRDRTPNEHDIHEILLTQAAIRTGAEALMREARGMGEDLDGCHTRSRISTH
jgi:hypothetical protein